MTCETMGDLLSAYIDGQAAAAEVRRVEAHLPGCAACARKVRLGRAMKSALKAAGSPAMPAGLKAVLLAEAARQRRSSFRNRAAEVWGMFQPRYRLAAAFAAAGIIMAVIRVNGTSEDISIDDMLAAHSQYALTMPLSSPETIYSGLPDRMAGETHEL